MKAACVFLLLAVLGNARADDFVAATVASYHFDRERKYNEQNFGLGWERSITDNAYVHVGFYKNSFSEDTFYALGGYAPLRAGKWKIGAMFGAVTGYRHSVDPMLTASAIREWKNFGVNILVAPAAVAVQIKWRLK